MVTGGVSDGTEINENMKWTKRNENGDVDAAHVM